MYFANRADAGRLLAKRLAHLKGPDTVVFALPRGGVAIAVEIARALDAPLDLIMARKIGHPGSPEYAIAAIAEDGHMIGSEEELAMVDQSWLEREKERQRREARRRRVAYLGTRAPLTAEGRVAILVDDGVATGLTLRVGIMELRHRRPKRLIVAVPVIPSSTADLVRAEADELVALEIPDDRLYLGAVGAYYDDFTPVEDEDVVALIQRVAPAESNRHGT